jgi:hypothetical protein
MYAARGGRDLQKGDLPVQLGRALEQMRIAEKAFG